MTSSPTRRFLAAVASGVLVALVGYLANALAFFVGNQLSVATLLLGLSEFVFCAIVAAVLLVLGALIGAHNRWWVSAVIGLIVGIVSALAGVAILFLIQDAAEASAVLPVVSALVNFTLIFWLTVAVAMPTVGRRLYWLIVEYRSPTLRPVALVRIPSPRIAEGIVTFAPRVLVDPAEADKQWDAYVAAFAEHGWDTQEVPPLESSPDSVFVEDTAVVVGSTAVIARSGAESRRSETAALETVLEGRGFHVEVIESPGTLDGGDVLVVGSTVYVGRSGRTNAEGIRQLRRLVAEEDATVVAVPVRKSLHLKSAASALPDGTVIGAPDLLEDPTVFERFLPVPEAEGAAVVILDSATVLMSTSAPATAALIRDLGFEVVTVDLGEFEKLEGGATCLSICLRP